MDILSVSIIVSSILFAGAILLLLIWYAFFFEVYNFRLSKVSIFTRDKNCSNLKSGAQHKKDKPLFTILHLSDFHLRKSKKGRRLFDFVKSLQGFVPDIILITGDLVESNDNFDYLVEMLEGFRAVYGKFAVFGVHDYYNKTVLEFLKNMVKRKKAYGRQNDTEALIKKLKGIGIEVLDNKRIYLDTSGTKDIEILGLGDAIIGKADTAKLFKDIESFRDRSQKRKMQKEKFQLKRKKVHDLYHDDKIVIAVTHTPDTELLSELSLKGIDLAFCGHTHGGQVCLPGIGALITGSNIRAAYASGLFYFNDFVLYISRGLGEGRYSPFRFYCPPQASMISIF